MNWTLGIDTTSMELCIGIIEPNNFSSSYCRYRRGSHAEHIAQSLDFMLGSSGITATDISRIGIAIGPGSFTGLRIGLAFIKGFCFGRPVKVLPVSSLESIARSCSGLCGTVFTVIDARNEYAYWAQFEINGYSIKRLTEDQFTKIKILIDKIGPNDKVIIDNLGYPNSNILSFFKDIKVVLRVEELALQRGLACARVASTLEENSSAFMSAEAVMPNYCHPNFDSYSGA